MPIPQDCGITIPWARSMWWRRDDSAITAPHSSKLTLVSFCTMNVYPSPTNLRLYAATPY